MLGVWGYLFMLYPVSRWAILDLLFILTAVIATLLSIILNKKYKQLLEVDKLTGLMTKYMFCRLVEKKLQTAKPNEYLVAAIDVEKFKNINTSYGYAAGNTLLGILSERLQKCFASNNAILAHEHYDIFIVFMKNNYNGKTLCGKDKCTNCICKETTQKLNMDIPFGLNVGVYVINDPKEELEYILDCAHSARDANKSVYDSAITLFTEEMKQKQIKKNMIVSTMESALKNDEFYIELQPKFNLATGEIVRAEALVRWETTGGKRFYPDEFIPIFEENSFIIELDAYVFAKVCELVSNYSDIVPRIAVNLSAVTAGHKDLILTYKAILEKYNVEASSIEIEVTESALSGNFAHIYKHIQMLKEMGFTVAIDDFGTGVSSLARLKDMNVDVLKIDKSFVNDIATKKGRFIVESMITMAKGLPLDTVAEGIETQSQLQILQELGCDVGQGYHFAKPMRVEVFLQFLDSHTVIVHKEL